MDGEAALGGLLLELLEVELQPVGAHTCRDERNADQAQVADGVQDEAHARRLRRELLRLHDLDLLARIHLAHLPRVAAAQLGPAQQRHRQAPLRAAAAVAPLELGTEEPQLGRPRHEVLREGQRGLRRAGLGDLLLRGAGRLRAGDLVHDGDADVVCAVCMLICRKQAARGP